MEIRDIFDGVHIKFLIKDGKIIAYGWHYDEEKALIQLRKIMEYHNIDGEIRDNGKLRKWLFDEIEKVVMENKKIMLLKVEYKNKSVYQELIKTNCGELTKYGELSKRAGIKYASMLVALLRNPLQVLIPCHRLITSKGELMGFYPLGIEVKEKLIELEKRCRKVL